MKKRLVVLLIASMAMLSGCLGTTIDINGVVSTEEQAAMNLGTKAAFIVFPDSAEIVNRYSGLILVTVDAMEDVALADYDETITGLLDEVTEINGVPVTDAERSMAVDFYILAKAKFMARLNSLGVDIPVDMTVGIKAMIQTAYSVSGDIIAATE